MDAKRRLKEVLFGSDSDSEREGEGEGAERLAQVLFGSDSDSEGEGAEGGLPPKKRRVEETLGVEETLRLGLLGKIIHDVMGPPHDRRIRNMILMNATKGKPVWARAFSNLRGNTVIRPTAKDKYELVDEKGGVPAPERMYQAARFVGGIPDGTILETYDGPVTKQYPSSFSVLDEWWQRLPTEQQLDELAKIRGRSQSRTFWTGVSGIFAKLLKSAITKKTADGRLVMKKKAPEPVQGWLKDLGLTMPTIVEQGPDVMRDAVREKLTSPQFNQFIKDHLVGGRLPVYIAETPLRGSGRGNKWVATMELRTRHKNARAREKAGHV